MTRDRRHTGGVLFAGGGTGGHIYPNVGIVEALRARRPDARVHFLVSNRPGDATIMERLGEAWTASPVLPLPSIRSLRQVLDFARAWRRGTKQMRAVLQEQGIDVVVATGGFVSGPAIATAASAGLHRAMVNLDGVPGQANRLLVRRCERVFTAYPSSRLPGAETIGLPMRSESVGSSDAREAKQALSFDPDKPLLFVTGATHGATSIIETLVALTKRAPFVQALDGWQVLHQCGTYDPAALQAEYDKAGVMARAVDYLSAMGQAWAAADLAISRAGAGSVAEAWANAAPTVFLPNPYHRDQHQRHNAEPMVAGGGAIIRTDAIDAERNADALLPTLVELLSDADRRASMKDAGRTSCPPDGAAAVARWIDRVLG